MSQTKMDKKNVTDKGDFLTIALTVIAFIMFFFLGYYFSYSQAVDHANSEMNKIMNDNDCIQNCLSNRLYFGKSDAIMPIEVVKANISYNLTGD